MSIALLIVDIQNDYFPGGLNELWKSDEACSNAKLLLNHFRSNNVPVVYIQHIAGSAAKFFKPDSEGAKIYNKIAPEPGEPVFVKTYANSFRETGLKEHLETSGIKKLVICGMMTHMCIDAAVRAAVDYGFDCVLAGDACATQDLKYKNADIPAESVHFSFLSALSGYAKVMDTGEIIASF